MGLIPVGADQLATVVTTLAMTERPRPRPLPAAPLRLVHWRQPTADAYRALFRRVGQRWLWFSRLLLDDAALCAVIHDPAVAVHAVLDRQGIEVGLLELDFRQSDVCAIAYLALVPELTGRGHGRWLMAHALALGWRAGVTQLSVRTGSLDHPSALGFYRAQGFVPARRHVETFPDPRLLGVLPRDAAPQIPLLATAS
ncbi:GNAT family N-acetyltransferase [Sphingomonas nostoxanthinifaciens]|uniref:GNAT family N-acetyltransferase n=1 Tax=Sphingomonas nostoxanthinifaciens TaxID=2872652 RepID=UPI001CC1E30F|nr:GNAT family N-acetyltransferase [Sphingomonas nostoxanthinifaciens]UAK25141.1 GNAT family N-acetyltransferase [Sphingomonas nostoxanthinifaciens]